MPKSRPDAAPTTRETKTPVQLARDAADAMARAAAECCRQHDRVSRVHGKSDEDAELVAAQKACDHCDETLAALSQSYHQTAASVQPKGDDEGWWHRANALWLASREYLRRHSFTDRASRDLKSHDQDKMEQLHTEFELEASALLGLRHAADAYLKDRPTAA
jgi:hypothetical protein